MLKEMRVYLGRNTEQHRTTKSARIGQVVRANPRRLNVPLTKSRFQVAIHLNQREVPGIEAVNDPISKLAVTRMGDVLERSQQCRVAMNPAAILGRASTSAVEVSLGSAPRPRLWGAQAGGCDRLNAFDMAGVQLPADYCYRDRCLIESPRGRWPAHPSRHGEVLIMIHLQCTARLLKLLRVQPTAAAKSSSSCLGNWHANVLFVRNLRLVVAMNDKSLLSVVLPLKEARTLPERWRVELLATLERLGASPAVLRAEAAAMDTIEVCRTAGKVEVGCLNEIARHIRYWIEERGEMRQSDLESMMEHMPLSALGWDAPARVTRRLLGIASDDAMEPQRVPQARAAPEIGQSGGDVHHGDRDEVPPDGPVRLELPMPPRRTEATDACYEALGRALEVAGTFSAWCTTLLVVRQGLGDRDKGGSIATHEAIAWVVTHVDHAGVRQHLHAKFPTRTGSELADVVKLASQVHADLIYSLPIGLNALLESRSDRQRFLEELSTKVAVLADATRIVAVSALDAMDGGQNAADGSERYVEAVVAWVIGPLICDA